MLSPCSWQSGTGKARATYVIRRVLWMHSVVQELFIPMDIYMIERSKMVIEIQSQHSISRWLFVNQCECVCSNIFKYLLLQ